MSQCYVNKHLSNDVLSLSLHWGSKLALFPVIYASPNDKAMNILGNVVSSASEDAAPHVKRPWN